MDTCIKYNKSIEKHSITGLIKQELGDVDIEMLLVIHGMLSFLPNHQKVLFLKRPAVPFCLKTACALAIYYMIN